MTFDACVNSPFSSPAAPLNVLSSSSFDIEPCIDSDSADSSEVIGSKTFALYAGLFSNSNKGDMSLFDYLRMALGSIRVSDRVPNVAGSAQKGIVVLSASAEMPKIHVYDAMQIVRDPYSGAGAGKVTITATALVSPLFVPHGTSQIKEVHPKLS